MHYHINPYIYSEYQNAKLVRNKSFSFEEFFEEKKHYSSLASRVILQNYELTKKVPTCELTAMEEVSLTSQMFKKEKDNHRIILTSPVTLEDSISYSLKKDQEILLMNGNYPLINYMLDSFFNQSTEEAFVGIITVAGNQDDPVFQANSDELYDLANRIMSEDNYNRGVLDYTFPKKEKVLLMSFGFQFHKGLYS